MNDVKQLYLQEFEEARIEYNNTQTRNDRKIDNYYKKVCESQNDIACEIIIELGDMDFWQDKDDEYKFKMTDVYNEQIQDLVKILPTFKVANATIHFDETSPHMHVIGVPVIENCNRGMKKQVGKSQLFTKTLLSEIQDKMRNACIKSYNKFYDVDSRLKAKQKGRNQDINVKDMDGYKDFKKQLKRKAQKELINRLISSIEITRDNKFNIEIKSIKFTEEFISKSTQDYIDYLNELLADNNIGITYKEQINKEKLLELENDYTIMSLVKMENNQYTEEELNNYFDLMKEHFYVDGIINCPYIEGNNIVDTLILIPKTELINV